MASMIGPEREIDTEHTDLIVSASACARAEHGWRRGGRRGGVSAEPADLAYSGRAMEVE